MVNWARLPNKYKAKSEVVGGIRFASKLEAGRFKELKLLEKAGEVAWFIRQPRFDLPGGVVYVADFLVVKPTTIYRAWRHGDTCYVVVEDCKGFETPAFKIKRKLMAEAYPNVRIELIKRR